MTKHLPQCLIRGALFCITLAGCVTRTQPEDLEPLSPKAPVKSESTTSTVSDKELAEEQMAPPIETDHLADGYCQDDIYGTFLRKQYKVQEKPKAPHKKTNARAERRLDNQAGFYAQNVLNGPTSPYFGGIPVVSNETVEQWVNYFKGEGRPTFIKWLIRAESFKTVVAPVLAQEGLPQELFYLAMIESGFSNTAASSARATGTWQFMKGTAQIYNLRIDHWVDERRDPIKSTVAAARYLRDLYGIFGDWYLAMAAYNAGPGKMRKAIRMSNSRDFWDIVQTKYLKPETKNYVPKVLAALNLSINAKQHGFDVSPDVQHELPIAQVDLDRPIHLEELSKELQLSLSTLRSWNPEINRDITPPTRGNIYHLRLADTLIEKFEMIKDKLSQIEVTDILMHQIKHGETLSAIARRYKVSLKKITELNPKLNTKALRIGNEIAVPIPGIVTKKPMTLSKKDLG